MRKTNFKKILICVLSFVLIAVMALVMFGCSKDEQADAPETTAQLVNKEVIGEGATVFDFGVTDADGTSKLYEVHTDKTLVGDALLELELIDGEDGQYGLYVKTVDGKTYDYDKDGKYWAFYENGVYATAGVDATTITPGASYEFKAEQ